MTETESENALLVQSGKIGTLTRRDVPAIAYARNAGRTDLPTLVYLAGFRSTGLAGEKATALAAFAAARDQRLVRFDYSGHGRSGGRFEAGTIGGWLGDALDVIDRLTEGDLVLVGSSMGGWLALLAAQARAARVVGLVAVAPAVDMTERMMWEKFDATHRAELAAAGRLVVRTPFDPDGFVLTRDLIEEGRKHLLLSGGARIAGLDIPIRLLHGMCDTSVPWDQSVRVVEALGSEDVRLTLVKDGDHRLSRPQDLVLLLAAVAELSDRPRVAPAAPFDNRGIAG